MVSKFPIYLKLPGLHLCRTSYILKLISNQCNTLEEYHLDISERIDSVPKNLRNFCADELSLCPGVGDGDVHRVGDTFVEKSNDVVVSRSRKCLFVASLPSLPCSECLKLKLVAGLNKDSGNCLLAF